MLTRLRQLQFALLLRLFQRDYAAQFDEFTKGYVMNLAGEVAQKLYMQALESQGLIHCSGCPQRFGLRRVGDKYYCARCVAAVKAA